MIATTLPFFQIAAMGFKVLQVSNLTPHATREQIHSLFSYLGRIRQFKVYPSESNVTPATTQKFAYIEFEDEKSVELGQHLTNTVLIDRAIICVPCMDDTIPTEESCLSLGGPSMPGQRTLPPHIVNKVHDVGDGSQVLITYDPTLEQLGLPQYPPLPANTDPGKVEEIRRTIYVGNIPKGTEGQVIVDFFNNNIGEVMYARMADSMAAHTCSYAYVEFTNQSSVPVALQNSGMLMLNGAVLRMQHSRVAIIKPQQKTDEQALEEIESAIKAGGRAGDIVRSDDRRRSRSRSRSPRRRSRSPRRRFSRSPLRKSRSPRRSSPRRRERSREREKKRSRSKSKDRTKTRSRSRDRKRSRSRERKRSRSRERDSRRDRDRSRDRKDRKRSRSRDRKDNKDRDRKRSRSREKKRDRSRERRDKDKDKKDDKKKDKKDEEGKLREKLLEKVAARQDDRKLEDEEENKTGEGEDAIDKMLEEASRIKSEEADSDRERGGAGDASMDSTDFKQEVKDEPMDH